MNCDRSKALVSVYVDGELSEDLAGPLRRHLMECAECRASVSEAKAMASWFVPSAPIAVPAGFAARVAQLATSGAGALGVGTSGPAAVGDDWLEPSRALRDARRGGAVQQSVHGYGGQPGQVAQGQVAHGPGAQGQSRSVDRTARFAMSLAAMAAVVLIGLTFLLASGDGGGFDGPVIQAQPSVENALNALDELNRRAAGAIGDPSIETLPLEAPGAHAAPGASAPQDASAPTTSPR